MFYTAEELAQPCSPYEPARQYWHKHKCGACGTTWKHDDITMSDVTAEEHRFAHQCPSCGTEQYLKLIRNGRIA